MLDYKFAVELYNKIKNKVESCPDADLKELYRRFLNDAVEYATIRARWSSMDNLNRLENDRNRTIKHDSYMSMLSAVCRSLGIEDIDVNMPDRKTKGDFACYIALFLALEER